MGRDQHSRNVRFEEERHERRGVVSQLKLYSAQDTEHRRRPSAALVACVPYGCCCETGWQTTYVSNEIPT